MTASDLCSVIRREKTDIDRIWVWEWANGDVKYVALVNGHRKMCSTKAEALKCVGEYQAVCETRRAQQQAQAAVDPDKSHHKKQKKNRKAAASDADPGTGSTVLPASVQAHTTPLHQDRAAALRQENEALAAKVAGLKARREAAESFCSAAACACALPLRPRPARQMQQPNSGRQLSAAPLPGPPSRKQLKSTADAAATKEKDQPSSRQRRNRSKTQQDATSQQNTGESQSSNDAVAQVVADALAVAKKTATKQEPGRKAVKDSRTVVDREKPLDVAYAAEQALKALAGLEMC